eukprot:scaffold282160_cov31-Tisochrysis_lutea.AAC.5
MGVRTYINASRRPQCAVSSVPALRIILELEQMSVIMIMGNALRGDLHSGLGYWNEGSMNCSPSTLATTIYKRLGCRSIRALAEPQHNQQSFGTCVR